MNIGIIGLGRMGSAIATRLKTAGHTVTGFDIHHQTREAAMRNGIPIANTFEELVCDNDIFWLMVPAGDAVDSVLGHLKPLLKEESIIIDGGNSHFNDSIRRAQECALHHISFIDCGTSGGVHGIKNGFCLMIGGDKKVYEHLMPLWKAVAMSDGYAHVGPSGAGHYVKMVHNGIEYALMQAYAEGLHLLYMSHYGTGVLDLEQISALWNQGSIIRSFLLELTHTIYTKDQGFGYVSGHVAESGMGSWTLQEARRQGVPVSLIESALQIRSWSRQTGGNYATKLVSLLRQQFGGHAITELDEKTISNHQVINESEQQ
jgi:6-phosphogluconate dehydrogenase